MKGLMIGMTYCSFYVSSGLWLVVSLPFVHFHSIWGKGTLSCGFWYILLLATVDVGIFLILAILTKWYKNDGDKMCCQTNTSSLKDIIMPSIHFNLYVIVLKL